MMTSSAAIAAWGGAWSRGVSAMDAAVVIRLRVVKARLDCIVLSMSMLVLVLLVLILSSILLDDVLSDDWMLFVSMADNALVTCLMLLLQP